MQAVYSRENVKGEASAIRRSESAACRTGREALKLDCSGGLGAAMHVTAGFGMAAAARALEALLAKSE